MAQYSMNAYDADVYIPELKGLMQYGDQMNGDLRFSPDCMNVETPAGVLQPAALLKNVMLYTGNSFTPVGAADKCSIMYLRGTNYLNTDVYLNTVMYNTGSSEVGVAGEIVPGEEYDAFLIAVGNKLYSAGIPDRSKLPCTYDQITKIQVTALEGTFSAKAQWSWCTYEHIFGASEVANRPTGKTNVIVLSNDVDGAYMYTGFILQSITTPVSFSHVARFAERIWGIGSGANKDSIFYSAVYSATDWTQNNTEPADGGGEIREATFDNDRLIALVPFGDALIAFSELRAWRINGSDPTNFTIQEQYGNGTRYPKSIAVLGEMIIMLGDHGLVSYDGYRVVPFMKEATYELFRDEQVSPSAVGSPVAIVSQRKYILALSNKIYYKGSPAAFHNDGFVFIVYDSADGSVLIMDAPYITSFCAMPPFAWATVTTQIAQSTERVDICLLRFDSWCLNEVSAGATKWQTPWITLGRKDIQKGGFDLYFYPELAENAAEGVTFTFSIQTEKKTKTKSYTVQPLTARQKEAGKKYKQKRLHFGGAGRRFRLTIETAAGNTTPWRLIGGIHIIAEIDKD